MGSATCFFDRVWIGNVNDAQNFDLFRQLDIKSVLTCGDIVLSWCLEEDETNPEVHTHNWRLEPEDRPITVTHLRLFWDDIEALEIQRFLGMAVRFVQDQRTTHKNNILIHCHAGQCRSATVAVAYLLFETKSPLQTCLMSFLKCYPKASLNSYLLQALIYFEQSLFQKVTKIHDKLSDIQRVPINQSLDLTASTSSEKPQYNFSCRLCRHVLFTESDIVPCDVTEKAKNQPFKKRKDQREAKSQCTSLFINPVNWVEKHVPVSGKLFCFNTRCKTKIGAYSWYGLRCACGAWHTPGFQIYHSRVDKLPSSA